MTTTKERVYDSQIAPLVSQIIDICDKHKIAMIIDFALGFDESFGSELKCTTATLEDEHEPTESQLMAWRYIKPGGM